MGKDFIGGVFITCFIVMMLYIGHEVDKYRQLQKQLLDDKIAELTDRVTSLEMQGVK